MAIKFGEKIDAEDVIRICAVLFGFVEVYGLWGMEKRLLIKMALSEEDLKAYKEELPPYHYEFSALVSD